MNKNDFEFRELFENSPDTIVLIDGEKIFECNRSAITVKKLAINNGEWNGILELTSKEGVEIFVESRWSIIYDDNRNPKSIL
jgi:hypothetical protein